MIVRGFPEQPRRVNVVVTIAFFVVAELAVLALIVWWWVS